MQRPADSSGSGHARCLVADLPLSIAMPLPQDLRGDVTISVDMVQRNAGHLSQMTRNTALDPGISRTYEGLLRLCVGGLSELS